MNASPPDSPATQLNLSGVLNLTARDETIVRYFNPADLFFFMAGATLRLTVAGEYSCLQVSVLRIFPITHPGQYFSIRDGGCRELGVLRFL